MKNVFISFIKSLKQILGIGYVKFKNKEIECEVKLFLNIESDYIPKEDLLKVEEISLSNDIDNLLELRKIKNLKYLSIRSLNLKCIDKIPYLENLIHLDLNFHKITNFKGIGKFRNLQTLELVSTNLTSLKEIGNLKKLTVLEISQNGIENLSDLSQLHDLKVLKASFNNIEDVSVLCNLKNLEVLDLINNKLTKNSIKNIGNIVSLKKLSIGNSVLSLIWKDEKVLDFIEGKFGYTLLDEVSPLGNLINLEYLYLTGMLIKDITALSSLKHIEDLRLGYNRITSFEPLFRLQSLKELNISHNRISKPNLTLLGTRIPNCKIIISEEESILLNQN